MCISGSKKWYFTVSLMLSVGGTEAVAVISIPNPPANFQITEETNTTISFSWNDTSNEIEYRVYDISESPAKQVCTAVADETNCTAGGIPPVHTANYAVRAYNIAGESSNSNTATGTTTHTWSGGLYSCLLKKLYTSWGYIPTRDRLESLLDFYCDDSAYYINDISPVMDRS